MQAVNLLHEEVASQPEEECGDMLVLPIYAALPPELQASTLPLSNPILKSQPLLTAWSHLTFPRNNHARECSMWEPAV